MRSWAIRRQPRSTIRCRGPSRHRDSDRASTRTQGLSRRNSSGYRLQVLRSAPTPLRGAPAATWPPSPRTGVRQLRVAGPGLQPWLQDTTTTRTDPAGSTLATPVLGPRNGVHLRVRVATEGVDVYEIPRIDQASWAAEPLQLIHCGDPRFAMATPVLAARQILSDVCYLQVASSGGRMRMTLRVRIMMP